MSKSYEFQAKNVEKAIERASDELNIPPEKIKHEVVAYGSSGIFGLVGVKKAKIKVFIEEEKLKQEKPPLSDAPQGNGFSTDSDRETTTPGPQQELPSEQLIAYGIDALEQIIDGITTDACVNFNQRKEKLYFSITGGDSGVLIGKRGQTLEAIQYLLEKMINKKSTQRFRVLVDVEGYLEKRKNNLQQMASRMAEKVKKIKKPVTIGQMNAHDRRIVHIHLKEERGVRTQSIGEGYYRKLMIFPKKQGGFRRKNSDSEV